MRFGFVTCVQLGLACMDAIYRIGGHLDLAVTLPDEVGATKSGRVYLDDFCSEHGIPLLKVRSVNEPEAVEALRAAELDWLFIIGWSQIARAPVLQAARRGVLGMHPTLLPQGRGRAPIPWAIIMGLDVTGVTLFKLDEGVDTGPIIAQEVLPIGPDETATTLYERATRAHASLIAKAWPDLVADRVHLTPQDETRATVWPKRTPADGAIRRDMDCSTIDRLVRGVTRPYPGAFADLNARRYRIWAGLPRPGCVVHTGGQIDEHGHLWLVACDGAYEATEWEVDGEVPPESPALGAV